MRWLVARSVEHRTALVPAGGKEPKMAEQPAPTGPRSGGETDRAELKAQWKVLSIASGAVSLLTAPAFFAYLHVHDRLGVPLSVGLTVLGVVLTRAIIELILRKLIATAQVDGSDPKELSDDALVRRRQWFWKRRLKLLALIVVIIGIVALIAGESYSSTLSSLIAQLPKLLTLVPTLGLQFTLLFVINFGILFGPLVFMGVQQIKSYEPGEADWGVRMDDVRGQVDAKAEIAKVVNLWQSGVAFEKAGGKRERGLLFLGAPGIGRR
jgi:cell division protease FtsH